MAEIESSEYRDVIDRYVEGFNEQDMDGLPEVVADDVVVHGLFGVDGDVHGIEEYGDWAASMLTGIPDARIELDEYHEMEETVSVRWTVSGTHRNDLFGVPPTERSFEIMGLAIFRMEDGKIAEKWYQQDDLEMFRQTGIIEDI